MRSVMTHQFNQIPQAEIQRSSFDRSHGYKTTFDSGYLVPFYVDEALPGDTFNLRASAFARLATPLKPVMDNMFLTTFFFAVPYRLVWDNWEKFNGAQDNPADSTDFTIPQIVAPNYGAGGIAVGSLGDYMGLPTGPLAASNTGVKFNALHFRAYNLIWNTWFRDQNLQNSVPIHKDNGPDAYTDYALMKRGKRHDYFTSCLPWPQKGPAVTIPVGASSAPIIGVSPYNTAKLRYAGGTTLDSGEDHLLADTSGRLTGYTTSNNLWLDPNGTLVADLSAVFSQTINQLREAFQLQKMHERDARGGTRYTEIIRAHFGVSSPDARLQRPEYLGGGMTNVNIHPVAQTTPVSGGSTPQGNLAGFGTSSFENHGFTKSFTEHCLLLGLCCVHADLTYQQGLDRMWSRRTRYDYYWPALSHLGEQSVLNKEIYCQGEGVAADTQVFGYQERYAEYRYKPSVITGKFRSTYGTPLDMWHLSQKFTSLPTLGDTFIKETPPIDRVVAVSSEPQFLLDVFLSLKCARPMPVYSVPGMLDHF